MRRPHPLAAGLIATCLAGALACDRYRRGDFDTPTDPGRQYLVLTTEGGATSLVADGVSRLRLTATIAPDSTARDVVFSTTAATLVGGTGTTDTERTVTVTSSGVAQIDLLSASAGSAVVTAKVKDKPEIAQSVTISFTPAGADALLRFVVAPAAAPADGASATTFVVAISPLLGSGSRSVLFETTAGSFARGGGDASETVPASADGTAAILLYSPAALGEGRLRATVGGASREVTVRFDRALPDRVTLALSKPTVSDGNGDSLTATATLLRDLGTVTPGTEVAFEARRADSGARFGLFNASVGVSAADGTATVTFSPAASGYTGPATMTARAPNGRSASVEFRVTG